MLFYAYSINCQRGTRTLDRSKANIARREQTEKGQQSGGIYRAYYVKKFCLLACNCLLNYRNTSANRGPS